MKKLGLSGNWLKIIAAVCMVFDHIGFILFPYNMTFRIIGRLAFPIFAFMISEGCRYTKNRLRYFLTMSGFAVICQIVYSIFTKGMFLNIFFTLSFAILIIYGIDGFLRSAQRKDILKICLYAIVTISTIVLVYFVGKYYLIDYGFWGCMLPAFAYVVPDGQRAFYKVLRIALFAVGLYPIIDSSLLSVQVYSYFALIPLILYNGKRGKYNMKYFFYIFYPLHLAILYGIEILVT